MEIKSFVGAEKVKKLRLQTHKRLCELFQMEENESICDFFTRVTRLVNRIKTCGEVMSSRSIATKILRFLLSKLDHVIVVIKESKDLTSLKKEELKGTFESHEKRMMERYASKTKDDVALQAQSIKDRNGK